MKKEKKIDVRVDEKTYKQVREVCEANAINLSQYLRSKIKELISNFKSNKEND